MKKQLRQNMIATLKEMSQSVYEARSRKIQDRLTSLASIKQAKTIALTMSNFPEVETRELIRYLWENGKTVVIPKCDVKLKKMHFYAIEQFDQLEVVYAGIEEPIPTKTIEVHPIEIDVVIVPGVIFNEEGYRIGFGGGYYDRFLASYKGNTVSIAFSEQVVASIPVEQHDLPVQTIVTDQEFFGEVNIIG